MPQAAFAGARGAGLLGGRVALVMALVACELAAFGAAPVRGAATIPDEPGAVLLDGPSHAAIVADVDGDGQPDLVRVTNAGRDGKDMAVEIWRQGSDGRWVITASAVPLRRGHSPQETVFGSVDADNLVPVLDGDSVRLLLWHAARRERVLAVVNAASAVGGLSPCCLTVWGVTLAPRGGEPILTLLINTHRGGDAVSAVDMDGDGTDELAVREPAGANTPAGFSVLRWTAGRFTMVSQPLNAGDEALPYPLGNSDGLPGEEIGLIGSFGQGTAGYGLTRVSLRAGAIHAETTELPSDGVVLPLPATDGARRSLILLGDLDQPPEMFSWPADKEMTRVARASRPGRPVGVIGTGADLRIMLRRDAPPALDLIGPDLSESSVRSVRPSQSARLYLDKTYAPYVGPWPDPLPGYGEAQVYAGELIRVSSGSSVESAPMAALPGMAPLGELGRNAEWTALEVRMEPAPGPAEMARDGGELLQNGEFSIALVRTSQVLTPEARAGAIQPAVENAVVDARAGTNEQQALLIGTPAFEATLVAPDGSLAVAITGNSSEIHSLVRNPDLNAGSEIPGPVFRIPIVSSSGSPGNQTFDAALQVITPAGHGYTARWHVRLLRTPPKIGAEAPFLSLTFSAMISGQTDPTATVTAEGHSTHADAKGRYQLSVPAGIVPRDVRVQARDPIGNVGSVTVSVVAPIDYRRLPWLPIVVLLTVAAGAILFVRAPRLVNRPAASHGDDGTLEEIDAD